MCSHAMIITKFYICECVCVRAAHGSHINIDDLINCTLTYARVLFKISRVNWIREAREQRQPEESVI